MKSTFVCVVSLLCLIHFQLVYPAKKRKPAQTPKTYTVAPNGGSVRVHQCTLTSMMYRTRIILLLLQAGTALFIAAVNHLQLFGKRNFDLHTLLYAAGFLAIIFILIEPIEWKFTPDKVRDAVLSYFPHNARERLIWIAYSLATGFSEEIVYRAVFFGLLYKLIGIYWVAAMLSAALFAYAHRSYGRLSAGIMFFVGLVLQWFVLISGGLYISIAIHFLHNLINGLVYGAVREETLERIGLQRKKTSESREQYAEANHVSD